MTFMFPRRAQRAAQPEADVCLIAEGCYPYVSGGVSSWINWLIRTHPDIRFSVLSVLATAPRTPPAYKPPENLVALHHLLLDSNTYGRGRHWPVASPEWMATRLSSLFESGELADFAALADRLGTSGQRPSLNMLLNSPRAWETVCKCYAHMPQTSFIAYFWAWRALAGGVMRALTFPLPEARLYHAVSTGYAGLVAARAAFDTGRPVLITEHGIYSNERRVEILMADWINNSIETGFDYSDDRRDMRDFWAKGFESFARIAYSAADEVIALYKANSAFQQALGADPRKLRVIPNGVDMDRFATLAPRTSERPTIAFIGRVTPIKDVHTFIDVAERVRASIPDLRALIIGPDEEDPDYARDCVDAVAARGLDGCVEFTGPVDVRDYFGEIDVMVLTSISEAQPLVILEAGAAGVPCIATDVGACREMLKGGRDPNGKRLPRGGSVAPVGSADDLAAPVIELLNDPAKRRELGNGLRKRVHLAYRSAAIADTYSALYRRYLTPSVLTATSRG